MSKATPEEKTVDVEDLKDKATIEDQQNSRASRMKAFLVNTEPLAREVGKKWKSAISAAEAVAEQKRK